MTHTVDEGNSIAEHAVVDHRVRGSSLAMDAQTKNASASASTASGLVQAEFDHPTHASVGADELSARKATLIGGFGRAVETTVGLVAVLRLLILAGLPLAGAGKRIEKLSGVAAADVPRLAALRLARAGRRIAVAGDVAKFQPELPTKSRGLAGVRASELDLERAAGLSAW